MRLIDVDSSLSVLDPACGDGGLLLAIADQLSAEQRKRLSATGFETDSVAAQAARRVLGEAGLGTVRIVEGDFLESLSIVDSIEGSDTIQGSLFAHDDSARRYDLVISNPPYVRTQVLGAERSKELSRLFGLTGRVDLAHAFVLAMSQTLKDGGVLALLTSNRFMTTQSGAVVREHLRAGFALEELYDLGDTRLFSAAVLPVVLLGRRGHHGGTTSASFVRVYTSSGKTVAAAPAEDLLAALADPGIDGAVATPLGHFVIERGLLAESPSGEAPWRLTTSHSNEWLRVLDRHRSNSFGDIATVKVGVKTTADSVFIRSDWEGMPPERRPEEELLRPLLTHHEAARWIPSCAPQRKILYPYYDRSGRRTPVELDAFPRAAAYLDQHRVRLESRRYLADAGRRWYEIWVPHQPADWAAEKIVLPDISVEPRFFVDRLGCVVNGDCYWLKLKRGVDARWRLLLLGIGNSTLATAYYDAMFHNKLYAGRRRFMSQYVRAFPLPDPSSPPASALCNAVEGLLSASDRDAASADADANVNELAWECFGLREEEVLGERDLQLGVAD